MIAYLVKPPYQAYIYSGHRSVVTARYASRLELRQALATAKSTDTVNAVFFRGPRVAGAWDRDHGEMIFRGSWR